MYVVTIITNTEAITTTINDITELHDLLSKYDYISVDVQKKELVKKKVKEWKKNY